MCIQTQAQFKLKHKPHIGIINRFVAETMSKTKRNTTAKIAKKEEKKSKQNEKRRYICTVSGWRAQNDKGIKTTMKSVSVAHKSCECLCDTVCDALSDVCL